MEERAVVHEGADAGHDRRREAVDFRREERLRGERADISVVRGTFPRDDRGFTGDAFVVLTYNIHQMRGHRVRPSLRGGLAGVSTWLRLGLVQLPVGDARAVLGPRRHRPTPARARAQRKLPLGNETCIQAAF
jgi:hypothetical protein